MSDATNQAAASRKTAEIRRLNDALRKGETDDGVILVTQGVQAGGPAFQDEALSAIRAFDAFTNDNDPYGEHDFAALDVDGERLFFKIDYYDLTLTGGSADPADPSVTRRVLTIMLASEY